MLPQFARPALEACVCRWPMTSKKQTEKSLGKSIRLVSGHIFFLSSWQCSVPGSKRTGGKDKTHSSISLALFCSGQLSPVLGFKYTVKSATGCHPNPASACAHSPAWSPRPCQTWLWSWGPTLPHGLSHHLSPGWGGPCHSNHCPWGPAPVPLGMPGPSCSPKATSEEKIFYQRQNLPQVEPPKEPVQQGLDSDTASVKYCWGHGRVAKESYHTPVIFTRNKVGPHWYSIHSCPVQPTPLVSPFFGTGEKLEEAQSWVGAMLTYSLHTS